MACQTTLQGCDGEEQDNRHDYHDEDFALAFSVHGASFLVSLVARFGSKRKPA